MMALIPMIFLIALMPVMAMMAMIIEKVAGKVEYQ
jgi:hypothetical protein